MILIYNETENPMWNIKEKNDTYLQIVNNEVPSFAVEVYTEGMDRDKLNRDALNAVNSLSNLEVLCDDNTVVRYDRWQLTPFIRNSGGRFNSDIVLASFDIKEDGRRLINLRNYNSYIYAFHYDYENHHLFVVFSLNSTVKNASVEVLFEKETSEEDNPMVFLKVFHIGWDGSSLRVASRAKKLKEIPERGKVGYIRYEDNSIDKYKFEPRIYMPVHLTHCAVVTDPEDKGFLTDEIIQKNRINPANMILLEPPDEGEFRLRSVLKNTVEVHRTTAITYICPKIKKSEVTETEESFNEFKNTIMKDKYGDLFKHVFIMDGDANVFMLK